MTLRGLSLQYFRLHRNANIPFHQRVTLIIGANASGKTSILEAAHLLATGKSFRATRVAEMVGFGQELARVKGVVEHLQPNAEDPFASTTDSEESELETILTTGQVNGQRAAHRLFSVNGVRRQQRRATGILKTVLFRPEDMRLIEGSPGRRRDYLDAPLSLLYPEYAQAVRGYEQVLKRRNRLLQQVREGEQSQTSLSYWNQGMLKHGARIQEYRRLFVSSAPQVELDFPLQLQYNPSIIDADRAKQYFSREIAAGHSLIGPHKDDLTVLFRHPDQEDMLDIALYGSRGQQRLAVLWLKLVELAYLEQISGERPVLLLDDIFSELDLDSQHLVQRQLESGQSIVTSTDAHFVDILTEKLGRDAVSTWKCNDSALH